MANAPKIHKKPKSRHKTTSVYLYNKLPKLVYVPFVWGKKDQELWWDMPHAGMC